MNLRHLESFLAIVEEGSFTRAARRLGIAQPSLSQQIRSLEAELGGELIERLPRGIRLTAAGKNFLPEAQAALRSVQRAGAAAKRALGLETGELEIATLLSMAVGILPGAITRLLERHPDLTIRMHEYTHRALLEENVRNGVGDVALGPVPLAWPGPVEPLGFEELVVVLPLGDPLAQREMVPLEALADRHWILFPPEHGLNDVVTSACRSAGFQPRVSVSTTQVEAAARLAAAGLGPAMVPGNAIAPGLPARVVRVDPPIARELAIYSRGEFSPIESAFVETLKQGSWAARPRGRALLV